MKCTKLTEKLSIKYHLIHNLKPRFMFSIVLFTSDCNHKVIILNGIIKFKKSL